MRTRWLVVLFCATVIYLTLFYKLGNLAFIGADEPRYARIAEEMNLRSNYVTPTLNFRPWLEKPPLLFWLEAASFRLFGVHEWSARLPVALLALFALLITGWLSAELADNRAALLTLLVLSTCSLFFVFARAASTDMPLTVMLTVAMVCGWKSTRSPSLWWAGGAGIALGLAVLAKGPVAVVLFGGVFLVYFLITEKLAWSGSQIALLALLFGLTAVPWFWAVWKENGYDFVVAFWINHHLARFLTNIHHHSQPFWYYPAVLLAGLFPWICFLGSALLRLWGRGLSALRSPYRAELFLWLWILVPLLFFSLSESKLAGYVLPVVPPLAVIAGLEWNHTLTGDSIARRLMKGQILILGLLTAFLSVTLVWMFSSSYEVPQLGILVVAPLLMGTVGAFLDFRKRRFQGVFLSLVAGMTLFASFAYWKAAPFVEDYYSAKNICQIALPHISSPAPLVLYRYFHHTAGYYTDYRTTPEAISDLAALREYLKGHPQERYYALTQESGWQDLRAFQPRLLGHFGDLYLVEITPSSPQR